MTNPLLQPIQLGAIAAPNRVLMAPLTRGRSDPGSVPNAMMVEYYRQRAGAGLILTEATGISIEGLGWPAAPGIWNAAQTEAWKPATEAVHKAGGRIVLQLWHMGRLVHPDFLGGEMPVSASATRAPGHAWTPTGRKDYESARELRRDEIARVIDDYGRAAENAKAAGFDGVQLHGANGYLIDQFIRDATNHRDDEYGGPAENRVRLMREVLERLIAVWGAGRVSIRLSPNGETQGCDDSDPTATFTAAARVLEELGLGFLELREPGPEGTFGQTDVPKQNAAIRKVFSGSLVLNSDYGAASGEAAIAAGTCDAVSFGRPYISNPDLAERIAAGAEWAPNKDAPKSWYSRGPEGYIDYPAMAVDLAAAGELRATVMALRSWLFVPGDSERKLAKAPETGADAIIVDLEDAVAAEARPAARELATEWLQAFGGPQRFQRWVRINPLDTSYWRDDLHAVMRGAPDGIMLPKASGPEQVQQLAAELYELEPRCGAALNSVRILPLVSETPAAALTAPSYVEAQTARLAGLTWGAEDLSAAIGASRKYLPDGEWSDTFRMVRATVLLAAHARGVAAIDTLHADFRDEAGLVRKAEAAHADGFAGMLAIHPGQVAPINAAFTPSDAELAKARAIVAAFAADPGAGVVALDGQMLDQPHLRLAKRLLGEG